MSNLPPSDNSRLQAWTADGMQGRRHWAGRVLAGVAAASLAMVGGLGLLPETHSWPAPTADGGQVPSAPAPGAAIDATHQLAVDTEDPNAIRKASDETDEA